MNYSKIYFSIIENRKNNPYEGYVECHHIVPKSLGGTDEKSNLVNLSAREHFICHLLLAKMYSEGTINYHKMVKAFMMMLVCKRIYKKVGFDEFVVQTGYDKSKPNLVQRSKKLLPDFVPQNGKKRGE